MKKAIVVSITGDFEDALLLSDVVRWTSTGKIAKAWVVNGEWGFSVGEKEKFLTIRYTGKKIALRGGLKEREVEHNSSDLREDYGIIICKAQKEANNEKNSM